MISSNNLWQSYEKRQTYTLLIIMLFHVIVYDMLDITQTNARNDLLDSAENVSLEREKFSLRAMNISSRPMNISLRTVNISLLCVNINSIERWCQTNEQGGSKLSLPQNLPQKEYLFNNFRGNNLSVGHALHTDIYSTLRLCQTATVQVVIVSGNNLRCSHC